MRGAGKCLALLGLLATTAASCFVQNQQWSGPNSLMLVAGCQVPQYALHKVQQRKCSSTPKQFRTAAFELLVFVIEGGDAKGMHKLGPMPHGFKP